MVASRKQIKDVDFPVAVLSVKKFLQESNDPRFETIRLLTETRSEGFYANELKKMWNRLEKFSGGFGAENDDLWVYGFLNAVDKIANLPEHFYMSTADRKDLIERIRLSTKELVRIHTAYNFAEKNVGDTSFVDALQSMAGHTIKELEDESLEGKDGDNVQAIVLVRLLARHNEVMYGEPLNSVLATTALAVYGVPYSDQDISKLLHRRPV